MHAYFDAKDGNPKVVIEISGTKESVKKTIPALLDTGHNGSLSLPVLELINIGAKLSSLGEVEFANGHKGVVYYFNVSVTIDGKTMEVEAGMIESSAANEAIAGLELFAPYIAVIDFKNKKVRFLTEEELVQK
jgi:predicted aspartyl protease